jgi:hypothetical protein
MGKGKEQLEMTRMQLEIRNYELRMENGDGRAMNDDGGRDYKAIMNYELGIRNGRDDRATGQFTRWIRLFRLVDPKGKGNTKN